MGETKIEWCDAVWNPIRGCSVVSPGCTHCYAMKFAHRFSGPGGRYEGLTKLTNGGPVWTGEVRLVPEMLREPLRWRKPSRIFVDSMSDLYHEGVPIEWLDRVYAVMALAGMTRPRRGRSWDAGRRSQRRLHTLLVLTKRPERRREYLSDPETPERVWHQARRLDPHGDGYTVYGGHLRAPGPWGHQKLRVPEWPLPWVWEGVSVEDQRTADDRIPELLATPAALRFLSVEPLLGPISFGRTYTPVGWKAGANALSWIRWVIVGGESGPRARPCDIRWIRAIKAQCRHAGARVFIKQLGRYVVDRNDAGFEGDGEDIWPNPMETESLTADNWQGDPVRVYLRHSKGADMEEWPEDLRVREMPEPRA